MNPSKIIFLLMCYYLSFATIYLLSCNYRSRPQFMNDFLLIFHSDLGRDKSFENYLFIGVFCHLLLLFIYYYLAKCIQDPSSQMTFC